MKTNIQKLLMAGVMVFTSVAVSTTAASQSTATAVRPHHDSEHRHRHPPTPPAPPTTPNANCTIIVPDLPLSAAGLATPYQLMATDPANGPCNEANSAQSAFVQAAIVDPATGAISIYSPLVIDRGTSPAIAPVVPVLPAGAIVALWFGYDATNLTLQAARGSNLAQSRCVNGTPGSVFTQYAYCNAAAFFQAANQAIRAGKLTVPALGTAMDGTSCPSTRDFFIIDQDQSDNLPTMYLANASGATAQDTVANRALLPNAIPLGNPSDNRLLDVYVDGAIGCHAWTAPDLADPGQMVPALPLNELQARQYQPTPVALIPLGDPMTEIDGVDSLLKVNLYRIGVDQPVVNADGDADTARYCRQTLRIAPARMVLDQSWLSASVSPDTGAANSLLTFLAQRLLATYDILNCAKLTQQAIPVTVVTDSTGVAVSASVDQTELQTVLLALEPLKAQDDIADSATRMHP